MDKGTFAAASSGMMQMTKLHLINNNLANINTPGFKGQYLVAEKQEFEDTLASRIDEPAPYARGDHDRMPGVQQIRSTTDFTPGPIENTGNDLHVALKDANDFFVVNTPEGPQYTRAGNFTLSDNGLLVSADGMPIAGTGGEITVEGGPVTITSGGFVEVNGEPVSRLQVVRFNELNEMERVGSNRFRSLAVEAPAPLDEPAVVPRSLEMANVSAVQAMVDLISTSRGFELYTKSAQSIDKMNDDAISRIGRKTA